MSLNSSRRYGLRPDQFEMAQMIGLIVLAAVLDFLLWSNLGVGFAAFVMQFAVVLPAVVLGLRSIATKQPVLVTARWNITFMIAGFYLPSMMPWVVSNFSSQLAKAGLVAGPTMNFLMATTLLCGVYMWVGSRGYSAYGVTDASFREGLLAALKKLDLPYEESDAVIRLPTVFARWHGWAMQNRYEESDAVIRLPTVGADLHAKVVGRQAGIWVKPHKFAPLLEEIVKEMNDYYRSSNVQANKYFAWQVVIFGTSWMVLVLMGSVMLYCSGYSRLLF